MTILKPQLSLLNFQRIVYSEFNFFLFPPLDPSPWVNINPDYVGN